VKGAIFHPDLTEIVAIPSMPANASYHKRVLGEAPSPSTIQSEQILFVLPPSQGDSCSQVSGRS